MEAILGTAGPQPVVRRGREDENEQIKCTVEDLCISALWTGRV